MAGFASVTDQIGVTEANNFIPEIWSDEILAVYEKSLVLAPLVRKMSMVGKKGDVIHIPVPVRGSATAKATDVAVNIQAHTNTKIDLTIDQHFEYSNFIEDIAECQALSSMRRFLTDDAGYAMAKVVDDNLFQRSSGFGDGTYSATNNGLGAEFINSNSFYNNADVTTLYAADAVLAGEGFTDQFFRDMIQKQDDANTPMSGRFLVIPPSARNQIMGTTRYVSSDFTAGNTVVNGKIGSVYGIDVYVSSNCPELESVAENLTGATRVRGAILAHKDTIVLAEQKGIRSQTQYKQEFLGTMFTSDRIYGSKVLRPETGFVLALAD